MHVPEELLYTKDHEWILIDGNEATIGITDFAQQELGDVVFVELPEIGSKMAAGQPFGTVESVKAVSEVYCPLNGEVLATNKSLVDSPEIVNRSPYEEGWMIRLRLSDPTATSDLMSGQAYSQYLKEEAEG